MAKVTGRRVPILAITLVLLLLTAVPVFAEEGLEGLDCTSAILLDAKTGTVLYEKAADQPVQPASLTKMMTALLVREHLDLDQSMTVPDEALNLWGNNIDLKQGEVFTVEQLLNALMVYSANDAAIALGIQISGTMDDFLALMNQRAAELGMNDTHYISPNGLVNDNRQITTARDMGIIARKMLEDPVLAKIVKKTRYTLPATNKSKERKLKNTNKMLVPSKMKIKIHGKERSPLYEGTTGIKTGFMAASGYCLAVSAEREGTQLIGVVMGAPTEQERYTSAIPLMDYGFEHYFTYRLMNKGDQMGRVKVQYGKKTRVKTALAEDACVTLKAEEKDQADDLVDWDLSLDQDVKAPIKQGEKVGTLRLMTSEGEEIDRVDVLIEETVEKGGPWSAWYIADRTFAILCGILSIVLLLIVLVGIRRANVRRRRKRYV